jgi:hypothetical protein
MCRTSEFVQFMGRIEVCEEAKCGWTPRALLMLEANKRARSAMTAALGKGLL